MQWSVDDGVVGQLLFPFYDNMLDSWNLDCKHVAVALHSLVMKLRKKIPLEQRIVFVHIGV